MDPKVLGKLGLLWQVYATQTLDGLSNTKG